MFYTIYKITNKINNKFYIGMHKTDNLDDGYMGSGKILKLAIKKHGIENFIKEIFHIFDNEKDMKNKEKELVTLNEMSYNLCDGGKGGWGYVNRTRDHHLHNLKVAKSRTYQEPKLVEWNKSKQKSDLVKEAHRQGKYNHLYFNNRPDHDKFLKKSNSPETRKKRKDTYKANNHQQGEKNSQYGTCWMTDGKNNKKVLKKDIDYWQSLGYTKGRKLQCDCNA